MDFGGGLRDLVWSGAGRWIREIAGGGGLDFVRDFVLCS